MYLLRTVVGCALWVGGKSRERASRVRFAHEKTRAKIGTDDSPHVCPIFRACDTLDPKPAARVSPSLPLLAFSESVPIICRPVAIEGILNMPNEVCAIEL